MPFDESTTVEVSTKGPVPSGAVERAQERLGRVARHCREPVIHVDLRITVDENHPAGDRARAEASFDVKRGPVRAHETAASVGEAIDGMIDRLRRRVDRHESRLHRTGAKHHDGVAATGLWHHGDVSEAPRHPLPLPNRAADVVRRKSFAAEPMSIEEAAFDLDVLDHDFYLFQEATTGAPALLSRLDEERFRLLIHADSAPSLSEVVPVEVAEGPVVLDMVGAQRLLDGGDEPFVFHRPSEERPSQVLYRRHDGDYGVIELAVPAPIT